MLRTSKEINVYVESKSPLHEYTAPNIMKAEGIFKKQAPNLEESRLSPTINDDTLRTDFSEAQQLFKEQIWNGFLILNGKGYLTPDEWQLLVTSAGKNTFLFPDISLSLGTKITLMLGKGGEEAFVRNVLREKGAEPVIREAAGGSLLYVKGGEGNTESQFLSGLVSELGVQTAAFEKLEKDIEQCNYRHTKKRLKYLTLYDFILYHFGSERVFPPEELIGKIQASPLKDSNEMIDMIKTIREMNAAAFWAEYEKFREFQLLKVLLHWYSVSTVRVLNGKAYQYISEQISEETLRKGLSYFRIHTASLDPVRSKAVQQGTTVVFTYELQNVGGEIRAAISRHTYPQTLSEAEFTFTPPHQGTLKLTDLTIGETYFVSLFEYMSEDDTVKLGDLPQITPGISWPTLTVFNKSLIGNALDITMQPDGVEGNVSFRAVLCKGEVKIASPTEGEEISQSSEGGKILFHAEELAYDEPVTAAVFALAENGKYFNKMQEFTVTPKEAQLVQIVRRSADYLKKMIEFDFAGKTWPEEFGDDTLAIACRTDRYPVNPGDNEPIFSKKTLSQSDYNHGAFRVGLKRENAFPVVYISGWLSGRGGAQPVIRSALYNLRYTVKKPLLSFLTKDIVVQMQVPKQMPESWALPKLNITVFNKSSAVIFNVNGVEMDPVSHSFTCDLKEAGAYILIEASEPLARQQYQFINQKTNGMGKTEI